MDALYTWGLDVIRMFQAVQNPALTFLARGVTALGEPAAYILVLPVIFWCLDEKKGFRLAAACLFSAAFNVIIKNALAVPRPFITDPTVALITEKGFSTPSGHAQGSAVFWLSAALLIPSDGTKKRRALKICVALVPPLFIGLSRVYLGVHYPTDVMLGWLLGAFFALAGFFLFRLAATRLPGLSRSLKLLILAAAVFGMNALYKTDTAIPAGIFGFGAGWILLNEQGSFSAASGTVVQKLLRALAGIAGLVILYAGMKMLLAAVGTQPQLFRFLRYALLGFWGSYGLPKLAVALKLAQGNVLTEKS